MQSGGRVKNKIPRFQHILLDSFGQMRLKYENYSLRGTLFETLKQHSDGKSHIAKIFDGSRVNMKAASQVQLINNKKKCFQLCLDWTNTLVLTTYFLRARSGVQVKLRARKVRRLGKKLSTPVKALFFQRCILNRQTSNKQLLEISQIFNGQGLNRVLYFEMYRSRRSQMLFKKGILKNFTTFTGKHLCWSLLQLYSKETPTQVFSCKYCGTFKNSYFYRTLVVAA